MYGSWGVDHTSESGSSATVWHCLKLHVAPGPYCQITVYINGHTAFLLLISLSECEENVFAFFLFKLMCEAKPLAAKREKITTPMSRCFLTRTSIFVLIVQTENKTWITTWNNTTYLHHSPCQAKPKCRSAAAVAQKRLINVEYLSPLLCFSCSLSLSAFATRVNKCFPLLPSAPSVNTQSNDEEHRKTQSPTSLLQKILQCLLWFFLWYLCNLLAWDSNSHF